jgi:hypothetical protein
MFKSLSTKAFLLGLTVNILVMCPSFGQGSEGPSSGNADAQNCTSVLLDRHIVQAQKSFSPEDLSIFASDIAPILNLADQLPNFGKALRRAMNKGWRFGFDGIVNCPTENSYYVSAYQKVACQTATEVILNPDWYEKIDSKSCRTLTDSSAVKTLKQKQRDIFVHELLLGITLGADISEESTSKVFAALTRQPLPSAVELQSILETSLFGVYEVSQKLSQTVPDSLHSQSNISHKCSDQNNDFICDSVTQLGDTFIYFNPRVHTENNDAFVITANTRVSNTKPIGEIGLCKALLKNSNPVSVDYGNGDLLANAYVAMFNDVDGLIKSFSQFGPGSGSAAGYWPISVITCRN